MTLIEKRCQKKSLDWPLQGAAAGFHLDALKQSHVKFPSNSYPVLATCKNAELQFLMCKEFKVLFWNKLHLSSITGQIKLSAVCLCSAQLLIACGSDCMKQKSHKA